MLFRSEAELALLDRLRQQRGGEQLADRGEIEDRVGGDRLMPGEVGIAEVEERGLAVDPHRDRNAAGAVGRDDRLNFFRDDLFHIGLRARRRGADDQRDDSRKNKPHESSALP